MKRADWTCIVANQCWLWTVKTSRAVLCVLCALNYNLCIYLSGLSRLGSLDSCSGVKVIARLFYSYGILGIEPVSFFYVLCKGVKIIVLCSLIKINWSPHLPTYFAFYVYRVSLKFVSIGSPEIENPLGCPNLPHIVCSAIFYSFWVINFLVIYQS